MIGIDKEQYYSIYLDLYIPNTNAYTNTNRRSYRNKGRRTDSPTILAIA